MAHTRSRSPISRPESTTPQEWLEELNQDVDPSTGYLVKNPTTLYGRRVTELVNYTCSQSSEVKSILNSRRIRTSPCCLYTLGVLRILADYVIPVAVALYASLYYYRSIEAPETIEPIGVAGTTDTTIDATTATDATAAADDVLASASMTGEWVGETLRYAASIPLSFLVSMVDGSLHVSHGLDYMRQRAELIFYVPLLFVGVYIATLLSVRVLLNFYSIYMSERALWNYQELILQETRQVVERAITSLLRPALVAKYQKLGRRTSVTHMSLFEDLATDIKARPLKELLTLGNVSNHYTNSLRMLIRHADDELSTAMFQFTNELHKIEGGLWASNMRPLKPAIQ